MGLSVAEDKSEMLYGGNRTLEMGCQDIIRDRKWSILNMYNRCRELRECCMDTFSTHR